MRAWDFKTNSFYENRPLFGSKWHGDKDAVFDIAEALYKKSWSYAKQRELFHRWVLSDVFHYRFEKLSAFIGTLDGK
jgi:hypothetical protein